MRYSPKSIYRVHRVAWGAYKRVWRGGFSPVQSEREIVQGLANGMMENRQKIGIRTKDSYDGHLKYIPTLMSQEQVSDLASTNSKPSQTHTKSAQSDPKRKANT